MREGWHGDDYLVLFDGAEVDAASERYDIPNLLPGYSVVGLSGWDDFIVRDEGGGLFTIPTVPLDLEYLSPFTVPVDEVTLMPDVSLAGKIKWYVTPILFGGDPNLGSNVTWIDHETHAKAVRWWVARYRSQS